MNEPKILDKKNLEIEEIIKNKLDEIYSNNKINEILIGKWQLMGEKQNKNETSSQK